MDSWRDNLPALQERLTGPTFVTDTPGYEQEVAVFNEVVRHRPAVVVAASTAADVSEAVKFAGHHSMNIAVLNTGHGPTIAACSKTVMITTRRMSRIDVDAANSTARVQAGVRLGSWLRPQHVTGWRRWRDPLQGSVWWAIRWAAEPAPPWVADSVGPLTMSTPSTW